MTKIIQHLSCAHRKRLSVTITGGKGRIWKPHTAARRTGVLNAVFSPFQHPTLIGENTFKSDEKNTPRRRTHLQRPGTEPATYANRIYSKAAAPLTEH